jgi:predicted TIM-barrel fold metal-dependent hydrolase
MQLIDVHHHYFPPFYLDELQAKVGSAEAKAWSIRQSLDDMDRAGVETAVLSVTNPGTWFGDDAAARRMSRACNEYAAHMVADHPGRFAIFACLPLPDIEGSLAEIAYALDVLHVEGIGVFTNYDDRWLGDPLFEPVLAELDRRRAVLYTHPTNNRCLMRVLPEIKTAAIEFGTDTTRTIASLVFGGAAARYPGVRFIFSHAGGTMPYLIDRFLELEKIPALAARLPHGLMHELRAFYYDTAQAAQPATLRALTTLVDPSHVLFGTDFPYRTAADHVAGLHRCGFAADELHAIERANALDLLALPMIARV